MPRISNKLRKGFRNIVVDGLNYQYAVSFPVGRPGLIVVYAGDKKIEILLNSAVINMRPGIAPTWRGKNGDKWVGKYEVACLIKNHLQNSPEKVITET